MKDLIDVAGVRTTYGSRLYADHVPGAHAHVVERALAAGAEVVGKTNLPEFAWGVLGDNELLGMCHNPARPGRTTGGSSSGSAAALAAGLCDLALGTDTGCSIRLPAAACGVVGLKPQWGRIPLDGVYPLCPTLDTVGPMARSVARRGAALVGAHGRAGPGSRGWTGSRSACCAGHPRSATAAPRRSSDAAEAWVPDLERLGARVVESAVPDADGGHVAVLPVRGARVAPRHVSRAGR